MLNHKKLIDELTPAQKIALLVDGGSLQQEDEELAGLPRLVAADLWASNLTSDRGSVFPRAKSMANSFDKDLFTEVAKHLVKRGRVQGQNLFILPETKAPYHIYGEGLSEDPFLNAQYVKAIADELGAEHAAIAMRAPALTEQDVKFLQGEVDMNVLYDRTARPFQMAVSQAKVHAMLLSKQDTILPEYVQANEEISALTLPTNATLLYENVDQDDTIAVLNDHKLVLGGSAGALTAALENYNNIRRSVEDGSSTIEELNAALVAGAAISGDLLDAALDRRMDLADECEFAYRPQSLAGVTEYQEEQEASSEESSDAPVAFDPLECDDDTREMALQAARKSIVLLKNQNKILPIASRRKIAVLGDMVNDNDDSGFVRFKDEFGAQMKKLRHRISGYAKGYHLERDRSEELIPEAVKLAKKSDIVLVFLGMGKRRESRIGLTHALQLPANQLALLDAVTRLGKPVVAVVVGTRLPAMNFDRRTSAVMLIPDEGMMVPKALAEVLDGSYNPSGRLAFTGYDDPDADFRELQKHIRAELRKTGPFIGYRYYTTEGLAVKYPFGFGLSYGEVAYSDLRIKGDRVTFTLQNRSRYLTMESVQIYVGKRDSAVLRPQMELKNVIHVPLKSGQRKKITVSLEDLGVYDPQTNQPVVEHGTYEIYVSSAAGISPLKAKTTIPGKVLPAQDFDLSQYLHTVSDIRTNSYTMEASCEPMKKRTLLKTLGIALLLLTLFADVLYVTCGLLTFIDLYSTYLWVSIISGGIVAFGLFLLIIYGTLHRRATYKQKIKEKEATELLFREAEEVEGESIEELFVEEFDIPEEQIKIENTTYTEKDAGLYTYMEVGTTLPQIVRELEQFFNERGVAVSPELARTILAAVSTSRLIIVRTELRQMFKKFVDLLAEFFGTEAYHDNFVTDDAGSLLRYKGADGTYRETNALRAIYAAQNQKEKAHFVGFSDTHFANMGNVLMPYIRYFSNPLNSCTIKEEDVMVTLPSNMWFVVGVADGETLEEIEPFVANYAAVLDLTAQWGEEADEKTQFEPVPSAQLEALVYRAKRNITVDEDLWKSLDRIEMYVNERSPYHIGNKLFLILERYISVFVVCGGEIQSALDSAFATKLLPAMLSVLNGNTAPEDLDFAHTLESIFGEDMMPLSCNMFKHALLQMESVEEESETANDNALKPLGEALQDENSADLSLNTLSAFTEWQEGGFAEEETSADMPSLEDVAAVFDAGMPASEEENVQESASVDQENAMPLVDFPEINQTEEAVAEVTEEENALETEPAAVEAPVVEVEPVLDTEPVVEAEPVAEPAEVTLSKKELKKLQKEAAKQEKRKKKEAAAMPDVTVESEESATGVEASEEEQGVNEDVE